VASNGLAKAPTESPGTSTVWASGCAPAPWAAYSKHRATRCERIARTLKRPPAKHPIGNVAIGSFTTSDAEGLPIISIDTKSRELIGRFHQSGQRWSCEPIEVFDHDFPSTAEGVGIPYGIYDTLRNQGFISIGTSKDTSEFAVDTIRWWWVHIGRSAYPHAEEILIVADGGGSNGYRTRLWKQQLQEQSCNRVGMKVRVCHYPPGASKWNPIEHRLFAHISANWAAQPLESYETMLKYIRATRTDAGLGVRARINRKQYQKGIRVSDFQMLQLHLKHARVNPEWNYIIEPAKW